MARLGGTVPLKALIHEPTGAIVAAATTSLPEAPGGTLNWDYHYCWLRDASFTIAALLNAGYRDAAMRWRDWILRTIGCAPDKMRIMYWVNGGRHIHEHQVPWLVGYNGAIPVRVGNDAATQRQTDVVGELLDALDLMTRGGVEPTSESLGVECELVTNMERVWRDKGHGLWGKSRRARALYVWPRDELGRPRSPSARRRRPQL